MRPALRPSSGLNGRRRAPSSSTRWNGDRLATPRLIWADVDGDGDLDILVGSFLVESQDVPWVEVWENKRKAPGGTLGAP